MFKIKKGTLVLSCIIIVGGILVLYLSPFIVAGVIPWIRELNLMRSFQVFDGADKVYSRQAHYGAGTGIKSQYYWTEESIETVRNYYESFTIPFIEVEDDYGWWLIAPLDVNDARIGSPTPDLHPSFGSFCVPVETYDCVTVTLVDMQQDNLYGSGIMPPSQFRLGGPPPELDALPRFGTLIKYTYSVMDW